MTSKSSIVNTKIGLILHQLITQETFQIIYDPQRFENLLKDHAPGMKSEVYLLVNSVKEEIPQQVKKLLPMLPKEQLINQLSHSLSSSLLIQKEASDWIIQTWYSILDGSEKQEEKKEEKKVLISSSYEEYPQFFFTKNNAIISFFQNEISCMNTLMDRLLWIHSFQDEIIKKVSVNEEFCLVTTNKNVICIDVINGNVHSSKSILALKTIPKQTNNDKIPIKSKESAINEAVMTVDYSDNNIKLFNSNNDVLLITDRAAYKVDHEGSIVKKLDFEKQVKFLSVKDDFIVYSDTKRDLYVIKKIGQNVPSCWMQSFPYQKLIKNPIILENNIILLCVNKLNDLIVMCLTKRTGEIDWVNNFSFGVNDYGISNGILLLFSSSHLIKINCIDGKYNIYDFKVEGYEKAVLCNNNIIYFIKPNLLSVYSIDNEFIYDIIGYRYNLKNNEPFVFEKSIIFSMEDNKIICYLLHYHERWQIQTEGILFQGITQYDDVLFFITDMGYLYSISQRSGKINWSYSTYGIPYSKPIVSKTHLFVITTVKNDSEKSNRKEKFKLLCLDKNSGVLSWSANIDNNEQSKVVLE